MNFRSCGAEKGLQLAIDVIAKGVSWEDTLQRFNREEMHERYWSGVEFDKMHGIPHGPTRWPETCMCAIWTTT